MRRALLRAHVLGLWRDRGAVVMSFVLPVIVFAIFAAIFGGATGEQLRLRVAVTDEADTPLSRRLMEALHGSPTLRIVAAGDGQKAVERAVASGAADVGVVLPRDGRPLDQLVGDAPAPIVVVTHPARRVAGALLSGTVQRLYFAQLPDAALGAVVQLVDEAIVPLTAEQRAEAALQIEALGPDAGDPESGSATAFETLVAERVLVGSGAAVDQVAYYAGAVAALFVLLSGVVGASGIHDELESGMIERILAGPGGVGIVVDSRSVFLTLQGIAQATVVFGVAWAVYGVSVAGRVLPWLAVTVALAVCAAGALMLVATLCRTARQSHTVGNVVVLVVSAVGGSMVPRFLMPPWLQQAGVLTPNAWALDGYGWALDGTRPWWSGADSVGVLLAAGVTCWLTARWHARRWEVV